MHDAEESDDSDISLLDILGSSERLVKGNVTFDWAKLPTSILGTVPDPPQSAKKQLSERRALRESTASKINRNGHDKRMDETRTFVSENLAKWASRSLRNDAAHTREKPATILNTSLGSKPIKNTRGEASGTGERVFNFTNCQFTYQKPRVDTAEEEQESNRSCLSLSAILEPQSGLTSTDTRLAGSEPRATVRPKDAPLPMKQDMCDDSPASRLSIHQLLDIVKDIHDEDEDNGRNEVGHPKTTVQNPDISRAQREQHKAFLNLHKDLSDLARRLKDQDEDLSSRERDVAVREDVVRDLEAHRVKKVEREVAKRVVKYETAAIETNRRHEQIVSSHLKEIRRLQASNKEVIAANKELRGKSRDRGRRLKGDLHGEPLKSENKLEQLQQRNGSQHSALSKRLCKNASSQTVAHTGGQIEKVAEDKLRRMQSALAYLICSSRHFHVKPSNFLRESSPAAFEVLSTIFPTKTTPPDMMELCLAFIYNIINQTEEVGASQRNELAQQALKRLSDPPSHVISESITLLLCLIILPCAIQEGPLQTAFDHFVPLLTSDEGKAAFVHYCAVEVVHPFLRSDVNENLRALASVTLLTLSADSDNLQSFLTQCAQPECLRSFVAALSRSSTLPNTHKKNTHHTLTDATVVENIAVIIQKMSRLPELHMRLRSHPQLIPTLNELIQEDGIESEFLAFNVRSALDNLE
ncbi:uncharacterized protein EV422DRAFT_605374 [Fimicolochytrium jonesii]|uniref:uncharacterized protein n=1 Tax=Fimicolochytrium jonesii TaxID=1396493 RepID=UPI0022FF3517|nr:uncharacterized protein EV422DRAFT_605374 [Fimicolochytrium jonesii]KAI8824909.1 hypothetical protein EV422DRAFT_605374 [Fimicolochytrium jonesii]